MKTHDGSSASIKFAIGEQVSVNSIVGFSFIKAAKLTLDLEDDVISPGEFIHAQFKVSYKKTSRTLPEFRNRSEDHTPTLNTSTLQANHAHQILEAVKACTFECFPNSNSTLQDHVEI